MLAAFGASDVEDGVHVLWDQPAYLVEMEICGYAPANALFPNALSRLRRPAATVCRKITETGGQQNATFARCRGHVPLLARQSMP